jgi:hypothetical protein
MSKIITFPHANQNVPRKTSLSEMGLPELVVLEKWRHELYGLVLAGEEMIGQREGIVIARIEAIKGMIGIIDWLLETDNGPSAA